MPPRNPQFLVPLADTARPVRGGRTQLDPGGPGGITLFGVYLSIVPSPDTVNICRDVINDGDGDGDDNDAGACRILPPRRARARSAPLPTPSQKRRSALVATRSGACAGTCWSRGDQDRGGVRLNSWMIRYDVGRDVGESLLRTFMPFSVSLWPAPFLCWERGGSGMCGGRTLEHEGPKTNPKF